MSNPHRTGLLVIERRHWTLLNLDDGECRAVEFAELANIWAAPELRVDPAASASEAVEATALDTAWPVDTNCRYVVNEPSVLRLDANRVLSWSYQVSTYVELTPDHLEVLELLRRPLKVSDLGCIPSIEVLLGQLLAVSLVTSTTEEAGSATVGADAAETAQGGGHAHPDHSQLATEPDVTVDAPETTETLTIGSASRPLVSNRPSEGVLRRILQSGRRAAQKFGSSNGAESETEVLPSPDPDGGPAFPPSGSDARSGKVQVIPLYRWPMIGQNSGVMMQVEPSLSTGMIFAAARSYKEGQLLEIYDLKKLRPDAFEVLAEWEQSPKPAIFAFSDYLWNTEVHLQLSDRVKKANGHAICVHGGPNVPKYHEELRQFFSDNPSVDIVAHGEGEVTFAELLELIDGNLTGELPDELVEIAGISFKKKTGPGVGDFEVVTTKPRARSAELDEFPSPYLTGEFDELLTSPWRSASFETNRGCPYGCTFCDWGSNTNSRIRKFDLDRIRAEMTWAIENGAPADIYVADANVGIFARDVEVAEHIASLRRTYGLPFSMTFSLAKNTVKYSKEIIRIIVQAGILPMTATSAVQSVDPATLRAVERQNIKVEKYEELEAIFAEQGVPLMTDILMGLPGSTFESFKGDLQHCLEREVTPRTMEIIMLPNSPMNAPSYREKWKLVVDDDGVLVGSSTYSRDDYRKMAQLRLIYRALDHFGILRHLLQFLQWEHGIRGVDFMDAINRAVTADSSKYPLLSFVARQFDIYTAPPVGWDPFFAEVESFLTATYGIQPTSDVRSVLALQKALMPFHGRAFPESIPLEHDFEAYRRDRLAIRRGQTSKVLPLADYPPAVIEVSDPGNVCNEYIVRNDYPDRRSASTGNLFWIGYDWELASPFVRHTSTSVGRFETQSV